jgi:DNA helicase IV
MDTQVKNLAVARNKPYFARIDFKENSADER